MMQENEIPVTVTNENNDSPAGEGTKPKRNNSRRRRRKPANKAENTNNVEQTGAVASAEGNNTVVSEGTPSSDTPKPKKPNNRRKKSKTQTPSIDGNEPWQRDMKKAIDANQKMHRERLNLSSVIEQNSKGKIKITPLGGLGEIGGVIS